MDEDYGNDLNGAPHTAETRAMKDDLDADLPEDAETDDPEAPYGRKPDGSPYRVSSARRAQLLANRHNGGGSKSYTAPKPVKGKKTSAAVKGPDYRPALHGLLAIPQMALGVLAGRNPTFALDAITLAKFTGPLVDAVQDAAGQDQRLAAALEKLNTVGPYGALVGVAVAMGTQLAANHGKLPAGQFGTSTPDDLMADAERLAG